jgi:hypothetical protein
MRRWCSRLVYFSPTAKLYLTHLPVLKADIKLYLTDAVHYWYGFLLLCSAALALYNQFKFRVFLT